MTEIYDIRQHTAVLTPSKGSKTKYHCPVCNGSNLDIKASTGVYSCFTNNCDHKDIRSAIDKLEGKPEWKPKKFVKTVRPKSQKEYFYPDRDGNSLVKVKRIDDGKGNKTFPQSHWDGSKWVKGNPDEVKKLIPIYRCAEVQQAIERNELIFWVEGESTADLLWELGIPATTTIGGSGGYSSYGSYLEDLKGARLLLAPDRDSNGLKYIANFERDFPNQIEGYYLAGTAGLWKKPEGGMDIGDDIRDHQLTKEQILEKVISPSDYQAISSNPPASNESETNKSTHFISSIESGLVKVSFKDDDEGNRKETRESIGNHLAAIAYVNNPEQDGAALLLEFKTIRGSIRCWTMPRADLAGDGAAIAAGLLSRDYAFKRKQKNLLLDYLHGLGSDVKNTYTVTDSSGWVGKSFVLPHKTYGDENLKFRDVDLSPEAMTETKGSLDEWKQYIGAKCQANSRMTFVVGLAFAAPLLSLVGMEAGGFHLLGLTSNGKSTLLKVANSVVGGKEVQSWRSTANGLEAIATAHNHILLPIDELGQAEKAVGEAIYMLGNGQGKTRMTKQLANRKPKTWQLLFLSAGEIGLSEYMAQSGVAQKGGQEVRMPSIPAIPNGSPFGVFEAIHGCDSSKEFGQNIEAACRKYHGSAMDAFLSRLVIDRDEGFERKLSERVSEVAKKLTEGTKDHAVSRVANRFALTQVALALAHSYNLLPFSIENIEWSVKKMFADWLDSRGGDGSIEIKNACERIRHLIVSNEFSDRVYCPRKADGQIVRNLLGHRVVGDDNETLELLVPTTVFDKECCTGVSKPQLIAELQARSWLAEPGNDGRANQERRVNGKKSRFYVFLPPNFSEREKVLETVETVETESQSVSTYTFQNNSAVSIEKTSMETVETADPEIPPLSPLSPNHFLPMETDGDTQTPYIEQVIELVSTVSTVSTQKTDLENSIPEKSLKVGDRVYIPARDKHGLIQKIAPKSDKNVLLASVLLDDGVEINVLPEYLEVI